MNQKLLGQLLVLQSLVRKEIPEQVPPCFSLEVIPLVSRRVPPPHVLVHDEELIQLDHSQFTKNI